MFQTTLHFSISSATFSFV